MLLKEFKQIANDLGLSCYHDLECKDYSITLDNLDIKSENHIATWKCGHVRIYEMPNIEEFVVNSPMIYCGNVIIKEEYNKADVLRKYISSAIIRYKELKKEIRLNKIKEL